MSDARAPGGGAGRVSLALARGGRRVVGVDADPVGWSLGVAVRAGGRALGAVRTIGATSREACIDPP